MPRITPLRLLLLSPLCCFGLVFLWVVLPSPPVSWDRDASEYLWRGGRVTRVYSIDDFFIYTDNLESVQSARSGTDCSSFALDYRYDRATGDLIIGFSSRGDYRFNLSAALSWQLSAVAASGSATPSPSISSPFVVRAKTGDHDGINLPWFAPADAVLLFWDIHSDTAELPLRVRVARDDSSSGSGSGSLVEIWPDSGYWNTLSSDDGDGEPHPPATPTSFPPLLTISIRDPDSALSPPSTSTPFHVSFPTDKPSSSPSRTLPLRHAISSIIVPIGLFFVTNHYHVLDIVSALFSTVFIAAKILIYFLSMYVLVVLAFWAGRSFPRPFWAWTREFPLTRGVVAYLGARLMIPSTTTTDQDSFPSFSSVSSQRFGRDDNDDPDEGPRPRPLQSLWGFFTSRSPLDDLLMTFKITRRLVQPLEFSFRLRNAGAGGGSADASDEERGIGPKLSSSSSSPDSAPVEAKMSAERGEGGGRISGGSDASLMPTPTSIPTTTTCTTSIAATSPDEKSEKSQGTKI